MRHPIGMLAGGTLGVLVNKFFETNTKYSLDRKLLETAKDREFKMGNNAYTQLKEYAYNK